MKRKQIPVILLCLIIFITSIPPVSYAGEDKLSSSTKLGTLGEAQEVLKIILRKSAQNNRIKIGFAGAEDTGRIAEMALGAQYQAMRGSIPCVSFHSYLLDAVDGYIDRDTANRFLDSIPEEDRHIAEELLRHLTIHSRFDGMEELESMDIIIADSRESAERIVSAFPETASKIVIYQDLIPGANTRTSHIGQITGWITANIIGHIVRERRKELSIQQKASMAVRTLKSAIFAGSPKIFFQNISDADIRDKAQLNKLFRLLGILSRRKDCRIVLNADSPDSKGIIEQLISSRFPGLSGKVIITNISESDLKAGETVKDRALQEAGVSMSKKQKIIFTCTGNTCRSPMADGYLKMYLKQLGISDNFLVESRGTSAGIDDNAHFNSRETGRIEGFDLKRHRARQIQKDDADEKTLFFTLGESHKRALMQLGISETRIKVMNVPDPFNQPLSVYLAAFDSIRGYIDREIVTDQFIAGAAVIDLDAFDLIQTDINHLLEEISKETRGSHKRVLAPDSAYPAGISENVIEIEMGEGWTIIDKGIGRIPDKKLKAEIKGKYGNILKVLSNAVRQFLDDHPWAYTIDSSKLKFRLVKSDRLGNLIHNADGDTKTIEINIYAVLKDIEAGRIKKPLATLEAIKDEMAHFAVELMYGHQENPVVEETLATLMRILDPKDEKAEEEWIDRELDRRVKEKLPTGFPAEEQPATAMPQAGKAEKTGGISEMFSKITDGKLPPENWKKEDAKKEINTVTYSYDGALCAAGSEDKIVRIYNARTGELLAETPELGGWVISLSFTPDGRYLAVGTYADKKVRLYEIGGKTGDQLIQALQTPAAETPELGGRVLSLSFSPDGRYLAVGTGDGKVRLYETGGKTGKALKQALQAPAAETPKLGGWIQRLIFTPDGRYLAVGTGDDSKVRLYETGGKTGNQLKQALQAPAAETPKLNEQVQRLSFTPDGRYLAVGTSIDCKIILYETGGKTGEALKQALQAPAAETPKLGGQVLSISFTPDGSSFAFSAGKELYMYYVPAEGTPHKESGTVSKEIPASDTQGAWDENPVFTINDNESVRYTEFSPDGMNLAVLDSNNTINIYQRNTEGDWDKKPIFTLCSDYYISCMAFSPDGKSLAAACKDNAVRIYEKDAGGNWDKKPVFVFFNKDYPAYIAFSHDSKDLAIAHYDNTVKIYQKDKDGNWDKKPIFETSCIHPLTHIAFSSDGNSLAAIDYNYMVTIYQKDADGFWNNNPVFTTIPDSFSCAAFSPDIKDLAIGDHNDIVKIYQRDTDGNWNNDETALTIQHSHTVNQLAFSPDGKSLVSTSYKNEVRIYQKDEDGKWHSEPVLAKDYYNPIRYAVFSPDGKSLALADSNGIVDIYKKDTAGNWDKEPIFTIKHSIPVNHIVFSPDSKNLVIASKLGAFKIYRFIEKLSQKIPQKEEKADISCTETSACLNDAVLLVINHIRENYQRDPRFRAYADAFRRYSTEELMDLAVKALGEDKASIEKINREIHKLETFLKPFNFGTKAQIKVLSALGSQNNGIKQLIENTCDYLASGLIGLGMKYNEEDGLWERDDFAEDRLVFQYQIDGFYLGREHKWSVVKKGRKIKILCTDPGLRNYNFPEIEFTVSETCGWDLQRNDYGNYFLTLSEDTHLSGIVLKIADNVTLAIMTRPPRPDSLCIGAFQSAFTNILCISKIIIENKRIADLLDSLFLSGSFYKFIDGISNIRKAAETLSPDKFKKLLSGNALLLKALLFAPPETIDSTLGILETIISGNLLEDMDIPDMDFESAYSFVISLPASVELLNRDWKSPLAKRLYISAYAQTAEIHFNAAPFEKFDELMEWHKGTPLAEFFNSDEFIRKAVEANQVLGITLYVSNKLVNSASSASLCPNAVQLLSNIPGEGDSFITGVELIIQTEGDIDDDIFSELINIILGQMPDKLDKVVSEVLRVFRHLSSQLGKKDTLAFIKAIGFNKAKTVMVVRKKVNLEDTRPNYGVRSAIFNVPNILAGIIDSFKDTGSIWEYVRANADYRLPDAGERTAAHEYFRPFKEFNKHNNAALGLLADEDMTFEDYNAFMDEMEALVYYYLVFLAPENYDQIRKMPRTLSLEEILKTQRDFYRPIVPVAEKYLALRKEVETMIKEHGIILEHADPSSHLPDSVRRKIKELQEEHIQFHNSGRRYVEQSSMDAVCTLHEMINLLHQDIIAKSRDVLKSALSTSAISGKGALCAGCVSSSGRSEEKDIRLIDIRENAELGNAPVVAEVLAEAFAAESNITANSDGKINLNDQYSKSQIICDEYDAWVYITLGVHSTEIYINSQPPEQGGCIQLHYSEGNASIAHRRRARLLSIVLARLGFKVELSQDELNIDACFNKDTGAGNLNEISENAQFLIRFLIETRNLDLDLGATAEGLSGAVYRMHAGVDPQYEKTERERIFLEAMADQVMANGYLFTGIVSRRHNTSANADWDGESPYRDVYTDRMADVERTIVPRINQRLRELGLEEMRPDEKFGQRFFNRVHRDFMQDVGDGHIVQGADGQYMRREIEQDGMPDDITILLQLLDNPAQRQDYMNSAAFTEKIKSALTFVETGAVGDYIIQTADIPQLHYGNIRVFVLREPKTDEIHIAIPIRGRKLDKDRILSAAEFHTALKISGYLTHDSVINKREIPDKKVMEILKGILKREPNLSNIYKDGLSTARGIASGTIIVKRKGLQPSDVRGKILVSEILEPADDHLIREASGIITTRGGMLSHASIRAREFGKPSIVIRDARTVNGSFKLTAQKGGMRIGNTVIQGEAVSYYTIEDSGTIETELNQGALVVMDADRGRLFIVGQDEECETAYKSIRDGNYSSLEALILNSRNETILKYLALEAIQNPRINPRRIFRAISLRPDAERVKAYIAGLKEAKAENANRVIRDIFYRLQTTQTSGEILYLLALLSEEVQAIEKIQQLLEEYHIASGKTNYTWILDEVSAMLMENSFILREAVLENPLIKNLISENLEEVSPDRLEELRNALSLINNLVYLEPDDTLVQLKEKLEAQITRLTEQKIRQITDNAEGKTIIWKEEMDSDWRHVAGGKSSNSSHFAKLCGLHSQRGFGTTLEAYQTVGLARDWNEFPERKKEIVTAYWTMITEQKLELIKLVKEDKGLKDTEKEELIDILEDEIFLSDVNLLRVEEIDRVIRSIIKQIRRSIKHISVSYQLKGALLRFASTAVRSSGIKEDSAEESFAGQNLTKLNVIGADAVLKAVQEVWDDGAQCVLVEEMLNSQISGVAFSANVGTGNTNQVIINAAYGLGEGIVSGTVDPDKIVLDKQSGAFAETPVVGAKEKKVVFCEKGGTETVDVETALRKRLSLTQEQMQTLRTAVVGIEKYFGYPVDVEWAIDQYGRLVILQTRPITTLQRHIDTGKAVFASLSKEVRDIVLYRRHTEDLMHLTQMLEKAEGGIDALKAEIREKVASINEFAGCRIETNLDFVSSIYLPSAIGRQEYFLIVMIDNKPHLVYKDYSGNKLVAVDVENPVDKIEYSLKDRTALQSAAVQLIIPRDMAERRKEIKSTGLDEIGFFKDPEAEHRNEIQGRISEIKKLAPEEIGFTEFMDFYAAYAVDGKLSGLLSKQFVSAVILPAKEYLARQAMHGSLKRLKRIADRIVRTESERERYQGSPVFDNSAFTVHHPRLRKLLEDIAAIKIREDTPFFYKAMADVVPDTETLEFIYSELSADDILKIYPRAKNNLLWLAIARAIKSVQNAQTDYELVCTIDTLKNSVHNTGQNFVHYMPEADILIKFFNLTRTDSEETLLFLSENASPAFQRLLTAVYPDIAEKAVTAREKDMPGSFDAAFLSLPIGDTGIKLAPKDLRIIKETMNYKDITLLQKLGAPVDEIISEMEEQEISIFIFENSEAGCDMPLVFRNGNILYIREDLENFLDGTEEGNIFVLAELYHDVYGHDPRVVGKTQDIAEEFFAFLSGELRILLGFKFPDELTSDTLKSALENLLTDKNIGRLAGMRKLMADRIRNRQSTEVDNVLNAILRIKNRQGHSAKKLIEMIAESYGFRLRDEEIDGILDSVIECQRTSVLLKKQKSAVKEFVEAIRGDNIKDKKIIIAWDSGIGNEESYRQLLAELALSFSAGNIRFVAETGVRLKEEIDKTKKELKTEPDVILITKSGNEETLTSIERRYTVSVDSVNIEADSYLPVLEILAFAVTVAYDSTNEDKIRILYNEITGERLSSSELRKIIGTNSIAIILPRVSPVDINQIGEVYKLSAALLTAV